MNHAVQSYDLDNYLTLACVHASRAAGPVSMNMSALQEARLHEQPWTVGMLRHAVRKSLQPSDYGHFRSATGTDVGDLLERIGSEAQPSFLANITSDAKVVMPHPLNALGLHAFRGLMAERLLDRMRQLQHLEANPLARSFRRDGFLLLPLPRAMPHGAAAVGKSAHLPTFLQATLQGLAGWSQPWFRPISTALQRLTHFDGDIQHYAHVDTHSQCLKAFVWAPGTNLSHGPLHFVNGSHRHTEGKLRWLYERTRHLTGRVPMPPSNHGERVPSGRANLPFDEWANGFHTSIRVEGFDPRLQQPPSSHSRPLEAHLPHGEANGKAHQQQTQQAAHEPLAPPERTADLFGRYGFGSPLPMLLPSGAAASSVPTLVVVDTSGWHYRGYAPAGEPLIGTDWHRLALVATDCH